jgi:ankyrin repeat protein
MSLISRPKLSLITAVKGEDSLTACKILNDPNKVVWIEKSTLSCALILAADYVDGAPQLVRLLLEYGADVNATDKRSQTPLWIAAGEGHEKVVRLLLMNDADVNVANESRETPLWIAGRA